MSTEKWAGSGGKAEAARGAPLVKDSGMVGNNGARFVREKVCMVRGKNVWNKTFMEVAKMETSKPGTEKENDIVRSMVAHNIVQVILIKLTPGTRRQGVCESLKT